MPVICNSIGSRGIEKCRLAPDWVRCAAFDKHGVERVWIAYNRDEAGEKEALSLAGELIGMGINCYRLLFSERHGCQRTRPGEGKTTIHRKLVSRDRSKNVVVH